MSAQLKRSVMLLPLMNGAPWSDQIKRDSPASTMKMSLNRKDSKWAGMALSLLILATLTGCERDMTVTLESANPPKFKLSGSGRLVFFAVIEVPQGKHSKISDLALWEIRPTDENLISELPAITYGVVPAGFRQTIPTSGAPALLVQEKYYEAGGPAFNANGGAIRFIIKDGEAVEVPKPKP
jgi:hypothetical protein